MNHKFFRMGWVLSAVLALMLTSVPVSAQKVLERCTVIVTDSDGEPLPGAAVSMKGTTKGWNTDADGKCEIVSIPADAVLNVMFLGMKDAEISVNSRKEIKVRLETAGFEMDELVVVGYGTMRKKDLSGAITSVKGETINEYSSMSVANALQGRVAGVEITQSNGAPGASMQVRIRGANSIKGSNDPLWIIDGFAGDINMINNSDIESVEVLKDASATAIYGSRGANGVIIITTKTPSEGRARVEYNGSVGVQMLSKKLDVLDGNGYMEYLNMKSIAQGKDPLYTEEQIAENVYNTNWQDLVFKPAVTTDHSVNVSGGTKKLRATAGLSYFDQDGIVINSGYERFSARAKVNFDLSRYVSVNAGIIYTRANHRQMTSQGMDSVIHTTLSASPLASPKYDDGSWNDFATQPAGSVNPLAYQHEISRKYHSDRIVANGGVTIRPVEGLSIALTANMLSSRGQTDYLKRLSYPNSKGAASVSTSANTQITSNNIISYNRFFGKHHIDFMAGMTYEQSVSTTMNSGTAEGFISDVVETYDLDAADIKGLPSSSYSDWRLISFLGRLNYGYDNRYLLTVNFRSDGSSRYSKGNKWGYFPSAAAAWRISQESFMEDASWISELKLRVGYGVTGSTAISPYSTQNTFESTNVVFGNTTTVAYSPLATYLGGLRWESTAQTNVGVDFGIFGDRLKFTADYYYKRTYNLLNDVELPGSSGYTTALRNIGSISNTGVELQLDARIIDKAFKWDLGVNFSLNRSKILSLADHADIYGSKVSNTLVSDQLNIMREGEQMYLFYGYVEDGYDEKGNIVYKDFDGSGDITVEDKRVIGNPNPDFLLNFNLNFSYKGFSLGAFFQGSFGNDIYSMTAGNLLYNYNNNFNTLKDVAENHWTPENPDAKYPALLSNLNLKMSDRFVYDGTYLRLKNLELAYDVPCGKGRFISRARVYVSGQNLFTITSYPMWNPDVNSYGGGNSLRQGVDLYCYPVARTVTLGCRITF
ncbi:MAG: TonB-dependent receptor [Bacteroidales bacterium]|nr:TonB-dependent receptor [Bacteroidales bacterium]